MPPLQTVHPPDVNDRDSVGRVATPGMQTVWQDATRSLLAGVWNSHEAVLLQKYRALGMTACIVASQASSAADLVAAERLTDDASAALSMMQAALRKGQNTFAISQEVRSAKEKMEESCMLACMRCKFLLTATNY
jgi:hypothetical protein